MKGGILWGENVQNQVPNKLVFSEQLVFIESWCRKVTNCEWSNLGIVRASFLGIWRFQNCLKSNVFTIVLKFTTWPRCHCMMSVMSLQHLGWNANTPTWFGKTFGDVGHHTPGWQFIVLAKWYQRMCGWRSHWPYMFFEFGASFLNCLFWFIWYIWIVLARNCTNKHNSKWYEAMAGIFQGFCYEQSWFSRASCVGSPRPSRVTCEWVKSNNMQRGVATNPLDRQIC